jgi:hypothetical protein
MNLIEKIRTSEITNFHNKSELPTEILFNDFLNYIQISNTKKIEINSAVILYELYKDSNFTHEKYFY